MKLAYDSSFSPPAPALIIEAFVPDAPDQRERVLAKLDTAADISAVPVQLLARWELEPESEIMVAGYNAQPVLIRTYTVAFELPQARIRRIEVIPISESYVLMGRDILNKFYINLDGPELAFEMRVSRSG